MSVHYGRQPAEDRAEDRRMSFYDLLFLAAGGVIGSGWVLAGTGADQDAGSWAVFAWLIGGALMLIIAAVMVELSSAVPKTGGLIFLPLQSNGPLLATVVAAGLWVFYAVNPASEATAMVRGIAEWTNAKGLVNADGNGLMWPGIGWAAVLMLAVTWVNMLGPRLFLRVNNWLTGFKILVPALVVLLLIYAEIHPAAAGVAGSTASHGAGPPGQHYDLVSVLTTVTSGGVIYSYLGFQGPLDFAGNVKRRGRRGVDEAVRLRRAVYGTVIGSILLYSALQFVAIYLRHRDAVSTTGSPFVAFVKMAAPGWLVTPLSWLINLDMVLSPAGAAMVFTYVLTREVAALSRAHLTHRGLQISRHSVIPVAGSRLKKLFGDRLDVYWLILLIDFLVSAAVLVCLGGDWAVMSAITAILALIVYATPSVVLHALRQRDPDMFGRPGVYRVLPGAAFMSIAVILFLAGWSLLWPAMTALAAGCVVLFMLPVMSRGSRWYDAKPCAGKFMRPRENPSARSALVLLGFFALVTLLSLLNAYAWPTHPVIQLLCGLPVAGLALFTFRWLVRLSRQYMKENPPTLPTRVRP
jgi:amino acid transporter